MRIKRGITKQKKHKEVLAQTKGYRLSYSKLYKRAKEAMMHAGQYSYDHRKKKKSQFRKIWIDRINSKLREFSLSYSKFIALLKKNNILLNRKVISSLALEKPEIFAKLVSEVNKA